MLCHCMRHKRPYREEYTGLHVELTDARLSSGCVETVSKVTGEGEQTEKRETIVKVLFLSQRNGL